MFNYSAVVTKVIDGDTVDLTVDLGFHITLDIRTRLMGINAPEVSTPEGRTARDALRAQLPIGTAVTVETQKDPGDKYGRWLALIEAPFGDVCQWMLSNNYAVPYNGGPKNSPAA